MENKVNEVNWKTTMCNLCVLIIFVGITVGLVIGLYKLWWIIFEWVAGLLRCLFV